MKRNMMLQRVRTAGWLALLALVFLAGLNPAWARGPDQGEDPIYTTAPPNIFRHNVGLLDLMVSNVGVIGNPNWVDQFGAGWRGGEYLYAASLWIGAIASDNLAYVSTGAYEYELRPSLDPVDTIYQNYEGAPGGNRPGFSSQPDDDGDGLVDEDFPNGKDDDGDGLIDEDFAGISQQMLTCEYWDYTEEARSRYSDHRPLNLRVRQSSYAWSTEGANEFIGFDFDIINDGFELLRQVYLGFFVDSDAGPKDVDGYYQDDRGAYYTTDTTFTDPTIDYVCTDRITGNEVDCSIQKLRLDICYMYDVPDDGETAKGGDVDGFFGGMFLGHTTDPEGERAPRRVEVHTARFFNGSNAYPAGDPSNDAERYDLLQSGVRITRPTGVPDDYRYCFSAGPFSELAPGEQLQLQVAFVIGQFKQGLLTNAVNAQRIYNGKWRDVDDNPLTGVDGKETCLKAPNASESLTWTDPCDSLNPETRTVKETECIPDNYVDDDCDCCTPLFQKQSESLTSGLETLINWVGTVAPPPPGTNLDPVNPNLQITAPAGDRKVVMEWDNLSELTADPIQRKILFTGYKVWRVEGWNRPVGSSGPAPDDWQLLANVSNDPDDGLDSLSAEHLWRFTNTEIDSTHPLAYKVVTGSSVPGEEELWYLPVGRYSYVDTVGLKNGMIYFYDITAFSAWDDTVFADDGVTIENITHNELSSRPSATEGDGVIPVWAARPSGDLSGVYVVPNPYIRGENPDGWDLTPSNADPTGTKVFFVGLPSEECTIEIYSLAGDLVQSLVHDGSRSGGGISWNLISRNGQDVVSGVYIYHVKCGGKNKVGRFVIVR